MGDSPFFANYKVLIPICLSLFAIAGFIGIVYIMRRRKLINQSRLTSSSMSDSPSTTNLQNKQNRDQQYHAVRCQSNRNSNSNDSGSYKAEGNGKYLTKNFPLRFWSANILLFAFIFVQLQNTSKTFVRMQPFN